MKRAMELIGAKLGIVCLYVKMLSMLNLLLYSVFITHKKIIENLPLYVLK